MPRGIRRTIKLLALVCAVITAGCARGPFSQQYEYEEELFLYLDGSAQLNVSGSTAAFVALRGVDLPLDPGAPLDRAQVRAIFEHPGADVSASLSRRQGRRFVHVRVDVDDYRVLPRIEPFAWSSYRLARRDEVVEFRQVVGPPAGRDVGDVGWDGTELVAFRMHVPSEILFENSPEEVKRGNILEWEQSLADRLAGEPVALEVHMAPESILYTTLLLFGASVLAVAATFALVLWWIARRGREADVAESRS